MYEDVWQIIQSKEWEGNVLKLQVNLFTAVCYSCDGCFNSSSATGDFSRQKFFTAERHGRL